MEPDAPVLPGATLPDSARRKPSEIPSRTQSVSAFHPGRVSVGAPLLQQSALWAPLRPTRMQIAQAR